MSSIIRLLPIAGLLLMPVLHAQTTIEFDRITLEQGLSMNTVNAIVQDADGFIWFATSNGLNRYDGHSITIWHNDPADSQSLPFPRVQVACMDARGRLWVGTFGGGIGLLDEGTGTFRNIRRNGAPHGLTSNYIRSLHTSDADPDILWVGTNDAGVCALDLNRMEFLTLPPLPQTAVIHSLVSDEHRNLWSGTSRGLMLFDRSAGRWLPFALSDGPAPQVFATARDARGTLWLGTDRGLMEWDTRARRVVRIFTYHPHAPASLSNNQVWAIASDTSAGILWVGTDNGLNRIYTSSGRVDRFMHDPLNPRSVAHNITWALYRDRAGDIWGGTYGGGAYRIDRAKETFHHIRVDPGAPISISANDVYSLFEDRLGYLWVGTDAGLDVLHRGDRKRRIYPALRFGAFPRIPRSFLEDRDGHVWIGTIGSGLSLRGRI